MSRYVCSVFVAASTLDNQAAIIGRSSWQPGTGAFVLDLYFLDHIRVMVGIGWRDLLADALSRARYR